MDNRDICARDHLKSIVSASDLSEERRLDLFDVMRTTFAAREFTDEELPDETLYVILDNARVVRARS